MMKLFRRPQDQIRAQSESEAIPVKDGIQESTAATSKGETPRVPTLVRVAIKPGRIHRVYEDPSLYPMEEKRAETDRIIAYLQATGDLKPGTLVRARRLWRATGRTEKLWRVLLRTEEMAEDKVYEAAAVSFGFAPVEVSLLETVGLIDHLSKKWPRTVMPRLLGLGVLPVVPTDGRKRKGIVTFAAFDPTRREVRRMIETVASGTHSIRYLSRGDIEKCVKAVSDFLPGVMPAMIRPIGSTPTDSDGTSIRKAA